MISYDTRWGPRLAKGAVMLFDPVTTPVIARISADGELMGGAVYSGWTHESIRLSVASFQPNWMSREFLFHMFGYPFLQLEVKRIFAQVSSTNEKSLRLTLHTGFKEVARIPKMFAGGVDCIVACMEREDCRFLVNSGDYSEQRRRSTAPARL